MEFLSYLISGISLGSVYAIIALGYTMVYGIAKMLNFAHGDVIMVGGYISFCATTYLGLPAVVSILLAMAVCTVLGIVIEGLAYKPLRAAPSLAVLITAIGVSYLLQNSALLIWGAACQELHPHHLRHPAAVRRQAQHSVHLHPHRHCLSGHHGGPETRDLVANWARPCGPAPRTRALPSSWASTSTRPFP